MIVDDTGSIPAQNCMADSILEMQISSVSKLESALQSRVYSFFDFVCVRAGSCARTIPTWFDKFGDSLRGW